MPEHPTPLSIWKRIEVAQAELHGLVGAADATRIAVRPDPGAWSPMEHVRHLIFAEQHHFKPHLPAGFRWSTAGVPPPNRTGERRLSPVGSDPGTNVGEVFDAWARVHAVVRDQCLKTPGAARRLEGNMRHLEIHRRAIEAMLGL